MSTLKRAQIGVSAKVVIELSEEEVRALDGIFGYNVEHFLKVFYERMGKSYVQPHEAGVRSLHATIRSILSGPISKIDTARKAIHEALT